MTLPEIPRWPKRTLIWDPDKEERALRQLNESRRARGLEPFGRELLSELGDPDLAPIVEKDDLASEVLTENQPEHPSKAQDGVEGAVIHEAAAPDGPMSDAEPEPQPKSGDRLAETIHRDHGIKFVVKPKGDPSGGQQEHLGPDGRPHIHLQQKNRPEIRISSETLKPIDPADNRDYNRHYRKAVEQLTPQQRADIARKADNVFYRGTADADAPKPPRPEPPHRSGGRPRGGGGGGGGLPGGLPFKDVRPFDPKR